jgi:uncharacterized protein (TIRG00374 family)
MKFWRNLIIGFSVSAVFLWLTLREINWEQVITDMRGVQWVYLPLFVLVSWISLATRGIRWHILLDNRGRLWRTIHISNIGFLINGTLPFRIGELVRAYLISREEAGVSAWAALSTIATERVLDILALVVLLVIVLPLLPLANGAIAGGLLIGGAALLAFSIMLIFARRPDWMHTLLQFALRIVPFLARLGLDSLLDRILDGLKPLTNWRGLGRLGLWTVITWCMAVVEAWTLALIFPDLPQNVTVRAGLALAVVTSSLSVIIPFTPAGVGPFEAAVVFALSAAGIGRDLSATFAIVWHAATVLYFCLWGGVGLAALGLSPRQVWRDTTGAFAGQPSDTPDQA